MPELDFASGFYESFSKPLVAQECVNLIPIVPQTTGLSRAALIGTPGITQIASLTGVNRGSHVFNSRAYFVNGTSLFRLNADFTVDNLGQIEGSSRVSMADNGTQLCIVVPDVKGFIFTENPDTLVEITDAGYTDNPSKFVVYKDTFFVQITDDKFFHSNVNNGLLYDPLDFGTAEVDPDEITGAHVSRNRLYICGIKTIEPFQNVGGTGFVFQRIEGAVIPKGLKAINSISEFDNSFVFLGAGVNEGAAIWRWTGGNVAKISSSAIDTRINTYTDSEKKACFSMAYAQNGSYFVIFSFIKDTFIYDATASALQGRPVWHERRSGIGSSAARWRVNSMLEVYGKVIVADAFDGRIGVLDDNVLTEYGELVQRTFSTQPFNQDNENVFVRKIELNIEPGTAPAAQTPEPEIRMSFSDDGGFTFSNEIARKMGAQGRFNKRLTWWRQGRFVTSRILKFTVTEPIKVSILKLTADWRL